MQEPKLLRFSQGNAKLPAHVFTFAIPAGYTCPGAKECMARAHMDTGKITDGAHMEFRCYAASLESAFSNLRRRNWGNFILTQMRTTDEIRDLINQSLPCRQGAIRVHTHGDFFSQSYFDAWMAVAEDNPHIFFYAYTKSLPFWVARLGNIPANFRLVASYGGRYDRMIREYALPCAKVIYHPDEANGLPIDKTESCAMDPNVEMFCLLLHGAQPPGSKAAKAKTRMKQEGIKFAYTSKRPGAKSLVAADPDIDELDPDEVELQDVEEATL